MPIKKKKNSNKQTKKKVRRRLVKISKQSEEKTEQPTESLAVIKKRKSLRRKILLTFLSVVGLLLFITGIIAAYATYKFDSKFVENLLVESVANETNGRLEMDSFNFSIWKGVQAENIKLFAIDLKSKNTTPIFSADKLDVRLKLWKIFLFKLDISSMFLESPTVSIFNIDDMPNYKRFLDGSFQTKSKAADSEPFNIRKSPLQYLKFLVPIRGDVKNIGFSNLSFTFSTENEQSINKSYIKLVRLNMLSEMDWLFLSSKGSTKFYSSNKDPVIIKFYDEQAQHNSVARLNLENVISVDDFTKINIDLKNTLQKLRFKDFKPEPIITEFSSSFEIARDLESVDISKLSLEINDFFQTNTKGKISLVNGSTGAFLVDTKTNLLLNFKKAEKIIQSFIKDIKMSGKAEIKKAIIAGKVSNKKGDDFSAPNAAILAELSQIQITSKELGIDLKGLDNISEISANHSLLSGGLAVMLQNKTKLQRLSVIADVDGEKNTSDIEGLTSELSIHTTLPDQDLPNARLSLNIDKINAKSPKVGAINTKLSINATASITDKLKNISTSGQFDLDNLADSTWLIQCQKKCENLNASIKASIPSLEPIFLLAKPILSKSVDKNIIPKSLKGSLGFKLSTKGKVGPIDGQQKQIINQSNVDIDSEFSIRNFDLDIPKFKTILKGFSTTLKIDGDKKDQSLRLNQSISSLSSTPDGFKKPVLIKNLSNDMEIINSFKKAWKLNSNLKDGETSFRNILSLSSVSSKDHLPIPIEDIKVRIALLQKNLADFNISNFSVIVPSLGFKSENRTSFKVNSEMTPENIETKGSISIEKDIGSVQIAKIRTTGKMSADYKLKTKDLDKFEVESSVNFNHFSIDIPEDEKNIDKSLVKVSNIHGQIPLQQNLSINETQKSIGDLKTKAAKKTQRNAEEIINSYHDEFRSRENHQSDLIEKVDYGNIKPFYDKNKRITIDSINVKGVTTSDVVIDFEMANDEVRLKNYSMQVLGGAVQGQMNIINEVLPVSLSTSMHFTQLNMNRLYDGFPNLKEKAEEISSNDDTRISGTLHFDYDFISHAMNGDIDITSIGKDQLKMLLYYIDPEEKNPNITSIRKALIVGDLKLVKIPISNGEMGLDLDLRLLGAPIPLPQINRFPLSNIVRNYSVSEDESEENP